MTPLDPNCGDYLEAGNVFEVAIALCQEILDLHARLVELGVGERPPMWLLAEVNGIKYLNVVGNPVIGECMRLWAQRRGELIRKLADRERALLREVEG